MNDVVKLYQDLQIATEELTHQFSRTGFGLESNEHQTRSRAFYAAALESEQAATTNWFQRIIKFIKGLFERLREWSRKRKARVADMRATDRVQAYDAALKKHRENGQAAEKEATTILEANVDNGTFKDIAAKIDAAIKSCVEDQSFFEKTEIDVSKMALFVSLQKDPSRAVSLVARLTGAGQHLDRAMGMYKNAITRAKIGDQTVGTLIVDLSEVLDKINVDMAAIVEDFEKLRTPDAQPTTLKELCKSFDQGDFQRKLEHIPFMGKSQQSVDALLENTSKVNEWLEAIAEGANDGSEKTAQIRAIGPATIGLLASSPAQFMHVVNRFDHITWHATPVTNLSIIDKLHVGVINVALSAVEGATPQERAFITDYARYRAEATISTLLNTR